ncbi:phage tail protein, partial [Bartonella rattaustraliani]|uniref:phage tail protein n=1 Tax=Bartonella rattaustraliani TaxID=481139 RepID=UPI00035D5388
MSDIYRWSLTASDNAVADSLIHWSEGQSPHTVNHSARAMMQRIREYLSDTSGGLEGVVEVDFSGQQTVIRLQTKSKFLEYKNDIVVSFRARGGNVGSTTVSLNNLSGKPVYKGSQSGVCLLVGGEIQHGCVYSLVYDEELSGWHLLNPTLKKVSHFTRLLPIGFIGTFAMERLPEGWLLCDGQAYSRENYRNLFAMIGTMWGEGDGATSFNVPDLRGMFLRGFDYLGTVDADRGFATVQEYSMREHVHDIELRDDNSGTSSRRKRSYDPSYKRDLSSDPEIRRIQESAVKSCFDGHGTLDEVYKCISGHLRGAPVPMSLIEKYSKRCFSPTLWGYEDIHCPLGPEIPPSERYYIVNSIVDDTVNEECAGLTGDALERCNNAFEEVSQT